MAQMQNLDRPLSEKELQKLNEMLHSEELFDRMLERAVRRRRKAGRKAGKSE
jgi:hypothetical protein